MARTFVREGVSRTVSAPDPPFPATLPPSPMVDSYTEVNPLPAGIWRTEGAQFINVDIYQFGTSTQNTYEVLAWNSIAATWFSVLKISPPGGRQQIRTVVANWASNYAWVNVTGTTVAAAVWVGSAQNITQ